MINLNYKCKVNFVKLRLIWIDLCLKLVFENPNPGRNTFNAHDKPPSWVHHPPVGSIRRGSHEGVYGN